MANARKHIAVIGAGPAGLSAARALLEEGFSVTLFEQKSGPGGVWNTENEGNSSQNPVYAELETNVPRTLMTFSDHSWPTNSSLFPSNQIVNRYLQSYFGFVQASGGGRLQTRYRTEVSNVREGTKQQTEGWYIALKFWGHEVPKEDFFRGVVVAVGNYHSPSIPERFFNIGLREWVDKLPGSVAHSLEFKGSESYRDQSVLVIGNSASGWDISYHVANVARSVYVSIRRGAQKLSHPRASLVSEVQRFDATNRTVYFADGRITDIDRIILCTGYQNDFKFVKRGVVALADERVSNNLHKHMFWIENPTLAFVGLPKMTAAFTVAEAQSVVIARVFAHCLPIWSGPVLEAQKKAETKRWMEDAPRNTYEALTPPLDKEYVNDLAKWALEAAGSTGKPPPFWCSCLDRAREQNKAVREEYKTKGDVRTSFTSDESLGYRAIVRCYRPRFPDGVKTCFIS